jgi:hypothetical protein
MIVVCNWVPITTTGGHCGNDHTIVRFTSTYNSVPMTTTTGGHLCLFVYSGVQHIFCCVFPRPVYPMLPLSQDCPFLIAPSVFSNGYLIHNVS